jgi:hypothetical protein
MPRGGYRPGAGRPKGSKTAKAEVIAKAPADVKKAARKSGMDPLTYMLSVMNDDGADEARRDRMAIAAAPFVHAKAADAAPGKKEQRQQAAEDVASAGRFAPRTPPKLVVNND